MTPYFKKASIVSEIGWELQKKFLSSSAPNSRSPQRADTRHLPLQLCYLVRNYKFSDAEKRIIELHSPDGVHNCILRAYDSNEASIWFNSLHSTLESLKIDAIQDAILNLGSTFTYLKEIGWLLKIETSGSIHEVSYSIFYFLLFI